MSMISGPVRRESAGFMLIEALVTLLIVSFGLLGLAGMLMSSMYAGNTSLNRSNAVVLANEMADRIRANWKAVRQGSFDTIDVNAYAAGAGCETTCMTSQCNPADQAILDICLWKSELQKQLPSGAGSIAVDLNNPACAESGKVCAFDVTVEWRDSVYRASGSAEGSDFSGATNTYVVRVQP